jgi:hypothetical protein
MRDHVDAALVQEGFHMELGRLPGTGRGLIHHADRGSHYVCHTIL